MDTKQAIIEMLNGGKITREHWSSDVYLEYADNYFCLSVDGSEYSFKNRPDYGWVLLKPNKVINSLHLWVCPWESSEPKYIVTKKYKV
jgi:hypothetical protein